MKPITRMSAREQVTTTLRNAIFSGEFEDGQEIRQEDIAARLGVSRMPVREAFLLLERDGLLTLKTNKRAAVNVFTEEKMQDHYEIRALLEGEAAAKAAGNGPDLEELEQTLLELEEISDSNDSAAFVEVNEIFHRAIWKLSGSKWLESFLNQLWGGLPTHLPEILPDQMGKSTSEHREILEAIKSGDPERARRKMAEHLERSRQDYSSNHK